MEQNRSLPAQTVVVILAAGKGTRMGRPDAAKVCFEIDGIPAVNRLIATFEKLRFESFLLVVGSNAEQVMDTVAKDHPDVMYVYQSPQLGTGHAAKIASETLQNLGFEGNILVTMGDKFIDPAAIEALIEGFIKQQPDLALLAIPKTKATQDSGGRIILDSSDQAVDIIEKTDLARQAVVDELRAKASKSRKLTPAGLTRIINRHIPNPKKQASAIPELLALAKTAKTIDPRKLAAVIDSPAYNLTIKGRRLSADQIEKSTTHVNPSLYIFQAPAFYTGSSLIDNKNAQNEYYLTDVVRHLSSAKNPAGKPQFKIRTVTIDNPLWLQGFNSPDELLAIQDHVRKQKKSQQTTVTVGKPHLKPTQYCTAAQWLAKIDQRKPSLKRWLTNIYGRHQHLHDDILKNLTAVLNTYGKRFGYDQKVCIVRAPGRVNLMGRHVDHRGGFNNFLAINRETIAVAGLRDDNNVIAVNTRPRDFKTVQFNISDLIGRFAFSDWLNFVNSDWVRNMLYGSTGDWGNYIKAATLRLQHQFNDIRINGLNMALTGNVPIAAGLSSSSTIVVAALQAAIALNNFELTSRQFIDLCGTGEWFVGSRGGAGDHAAIYLGQRSRIARVGYLPFRADKIIDAPRDYQVVIANSHIKAPKSSSAKDQFNSRIASYNLGLALLKQRCPQVADNLEYLRDLNPAKLGCSVSEIYRLLLKVPQFMTRTDFRNMLSAEHRDLMETNFASHAEPARYNVRGVLLFGAAEIARSAIGIDILEAGRIEQFGELMNISHDGDRVSAPGHDGQYRPLPEDCSDEYLNNLIADLASEDPHRVLRAQLYMQPGAYACSTPQIDLMADIARSTPGVAGAQIAGAGLGGCLMVFAEKDAVPAVEKALIRKYYRPNKLKPAIIPCIPVEGAGLADF